MPTPALVVYRPTQDFWLGYVRKIVHRRTKNNLKKKNTNTHARFSIRM